jgi:hypothetical protein
MLNRVFVFRLVNRHFRETNNDALNRIYIELQFQAGTQPQPLILILRVNDVDVTRRQHLRDASHGVSIDRTR